MKYESIEDLIYSYHNLTPVIESFLQGDSRGIIEMYVHQYMPNLERLYHFNPEYREQIYNWFEYQIKEIRRVIKEDEFGKKTERFEALMIFENIIKNIFQKPILIQSSTKLKINANKNVIYDLFRQLKKEVSVQKGKCVLSQSDEEIAKFIIENLEGFDEVSLNTVVKEISREQVIKGTRIEVKTIDF